MKILQLASFMLLVSGMSLHAQQTESKVAAALKGKIIGITDGHAVDVTLTGSPEYYVFYYSASW